MPMRSESQRKWMWANHPEMAKRWEKHTPKGKELPEHVKKASETVLNSIAECFEKIALTIPKLSTPKTIGAAKAVITKSMKI